jgi:hypothetical protein
VSLSVVIPTLVEELFVGGAFRFALDPTCPARFYSEGAVRFRARRLGLALEDQAIFYRRSACERAGGFPHEPPDGGRGGVPAQAQGSVEFANATRPLSRW